MAQELEIEFKNLLTKAEYDILFTQLNFHNCEEVEQLNHYFETPDFQLKQHGSALRIREKNTGFQATLKQPADEGLLETHETVTETTLEKWKQNEMELGEELTKQLNNLGIRVTELRYGGSLKTIRREQAYRDTLLVLDKSSYHGHTDFEFELEAASYAYGDQVFAELLEQFQIPKRDTPNKIQRFYETLKNR